MAYNAVVWNECRNFAESFFKEAKGRLGGKFSSLFDEATEHYEVVAQNLQRVSELFPFPPKGDEIKDAIRCKDAIERLTKARKAEELGLKSLEKITRKLA